MNQLDLQPILAHFQSAKRPCQLAIEQYGLRLLYQQDGTSEFMPWHHLEQILPQSVAKIFDWLSSQNLTSCEVPNG